MKELWQVIFEGYDDRQGIPVYFHRTGMAYDSEAEAEEACKGANYAVEYFRNLGLTGVHNVVRLEGKEVEDV